MHSLQDFITQKVAKNKTKKNKDIKGNIIKCKIFELTPKLVEPYDWLWLNTSESENLQLIDALKHTVPSKLLRDFSHSVLYCKEIGVYLCLNRALIDPKMEFFFKLNERQREKEGEEEDNPQFNLLEQDQELNIHNFTGIENGMKLRNQIYWEKLEELKRTKEDKETLEDKHLLKKSLEIEKMTIILCEGGSFSIAAFDKEKELTHKSDKKYVIRKKQGGR